MLPAACGLQHSKLPSAGAGAVWHCSAPLQTTTSASTPALCSFPTNAFGSNPDAWVRGQRCCCTEKLVPSLGKTCLAILLVAAAAAAAAASQSPDKPAAEAVGTLLPFHTLLPLPGGGPADPAACVRASDWRAGAHARPAGELSFNARRWLWRCACLQRAAVWLSAERAASECRPLLCVAAD